MADIDDEPLFNYNEEEMNKMAADSGLLQFQRTTYVPNEVREECQKELAEGQKRGWKCDEACIVCHPKTKV
ncbi:MAG: hypothetical protein WCA15_15875 [Candidatus Acidiferrales bacterium]